MNTEQRELAMEVYRWAVARRKGRSADTDEFVGTAKFNMNFWFNSSLFTGRGDEDIPIGKLVEGSCGTSACLAGYVALLTAPPGTTTRGSRLTFPDGDEISIPAWAEEKLGLTTRQAGRIFHADDHDGPEMLLDVIEGRADGWN